MLVKTESRTGRGLGLRSAERDSDEKPRRGSFAENQSTLGDSQPSTFSPPSALTFDIAAVRIRASRAMRCPPTSSTR